MTREAVLEREEQFVREPFVFESETRELVKRTADRLNNLQSDKTYDVDYLTRNNKTIYYVFEITDLDEI